MQAVPSIWRHLSRTPFELGWVDAGGVQTRYLAAGAASASVVILLHGTAGSLETFCANYAAYARHFRVIGLDMLGCGWTDRPPFDYTISDYAAHVRGAMDALGITRAGIVGVSLGSWVGAALAQAHPQRISKLVMIAPAGIVTDADEERKFAEGVRKRRGAAAAAPTRESVAAAMKGLFLKPESLTDELIDVRLDIYQDPAMKDAMPRLLAFSLGGQSLSHDAWRRLGLPIQVIAATEAPNMFLGNAHAIKALAPHAELVEMQGCDHWAQFEQAETFNQVSIDFLQRAD